MLRKSIVYCGTGKMELKKKNKQYSAHYLRALVQRPSPILVGQPPPKDENFGSSCVKDSLL